MLLGGSQFPTPPDAIAAQVGWWALAVVVGVAIHVCARLEFWRRLVLGREDPRVFAILRMGLAICTFQNFWNLRHHARFLWSDEGIFSLAEARTRHGSSALLGWSEIGGFFDGWGLVRFFWGKHSILFMHGSPTFVWGYLAVFFAVLLLYAVGVRARLMGLLAYLLMIGLYNRNSLYFEGTDTVYKTVFFIMIFARTDAGWSVDNWIRRRREAWLGRRVCDGTVDQLDYWHLLDRLGHLTVALLAVWGFGRCVGVPVGYWGVCLGLLGLLALWAGLAMVVDAKVRTDDSLAPQVRFIFVPRWPRLLLMLQVAAIYSATGLQKTGTIWRQGDALYYSLNMDHFYPFENLTQEISAVLATNLFRVGTWVTHYWEIFFPVLLLGMVLRFADQQREHEWAVRERANPIRMVVGAVGLVFAWLAAYRFTGLAVPYSLKMVDGEMAPAIAALRTVDLVFLAIIPAFVLLRWGLRRRPIRLGKRLRIDGGSLRTWLLGRRVWLGLGVLFHGFLVLFMNIGMFPFIMLWSYVAFTDSAPWVALVRGEPVRPEDGARAPGVPLALDPHRLFTGAAVVLAWIAGRRDTPALRGFFARARRRDGRMPDFVVWALALVALGCLVAKGMASVEVLSDDQPYLHHWIGKRWWKIGLLVAWLCALLCKSDPRESAPQVGRGPFLAPSAVLRTAIVGMVLFHSLAIVARLWPTHPVYTQVRDRANDITSRWRSGTHTGQSWAMFAPNPPRSNTFLQTIVVDANEEHYDLRNNAFSDRPNPWIFNDRMRKMQRRLAGKGRWYRRYYAAFQCREWTLEKGAPPITIELYKLNTKIPPPEEVAHNGAYQPTKLVASQHLLERFPCSGKGELRPLMKLRRGMPLTEEDRARIRVEWESGVRGVTGRRRAWRRRTTFRSPWDPKPERP